MTTSHKNVREVRRAPEPHMVGDGLRVQSIFSYRDEGVSPFLLMDYGAPMEVSPSDTPLGVDEHPHKGFETVTIVYQGELEHGDSAGNSGSIGPGDVQWMTAASGIVHKEKWGRDFTRRGGTLEMIQLWVNLPARHKGAAPAYQSLENARIPVIPLAGGGTVRVIAGEWEGARGPARTFTPVSLWDARLPAGGRAEFPVPDGHTAAVFLLHGTAVVNGTATLGPSDFALLDPSGENFTVEAGEDATFLVLGGEPIDEPIAAYGPFVMNTEAEIRQAFADYRAGRLTD
jgi:redox-sensitive bicupin YhaK (pirin superfamily)